MGIVAKLRRISSRWDTPDMPRQQRGAFGAVLLSCLTITAAAIISTYRHLKHLPTPAPPPIPAWLVQPTLTPSKPEDALENPWRPPTR